MELKIIQFPKRNLCVYGEGSRLYYSTVKFKWGKRRTIEIFDNENSKLFQIGYRGFFSETSEIISQHENLAQKIIFIDDSKIILENKSILERKTSFFNLTRSKFTYFIDGQKVGYSKVTNWVDAKKLQLHVEENGKELLDSLIILILICETADPTE